ETGKLYDGFCKGKYFGYPECHFRGKTEIEAKRPSDACDGTTCTSHTKVEVKILIHVIGVRFKKAGKIYYFDPGDIDIETDDYVVVETVRGIEFGKAVIAEREVDEEDVVLPLKKVIRVADEKDKLTVVENQERAETAFRTCADKIKEHSLDMNLVEVEYTFDRNKIIFYFTAEGRVEIGRAHVCTP